jgi:ABC-type transport system involved in Fe-S cluster assembly fused permease/ATPase subunit
MLLAVLASPLYALGWVVGMVVVAVLWLFAATTVGFTDARDRSRRRS